MGEREPLRSHQDSVFRMLFSDKASVIELFNALEDADYGADTEVEFTTLEDAVYADLKNDLGFIIDNRHIILTEHQSTISNNMPLRLLEYIARTFERITDAAKLYQSSLVKIPAPEFFIIYTGEQRWGTRTLRLSDSFLAEPPENSIELVVKIIDVRYNDDEEERQDQESRKVLARSDKLRGYSTLLSYIRRERQTGYELKEGIGRAIQRCIREGILREFLEKYSAEVGSMLFKEITSEEFAEIRAKEAAEIYYNKGRQEGIEAGRQEGINNLIAICRELGLTDEQIAEKLAEKYQLDIETAQEYTRGD